MSTQSAAAPQVANLPTEAKSRNMDSVQPNDVPPTTVHNHDCDWDAFDPRSYHSDNYRTVRDDDRQIVELVRDFFASAEVPSGALGVDVGPGANLYPALAMLPFCTGVDLLEFSASNVRWLRRRRAWWRGRWDRSWDQFWRVYAESPAYRALGSEHAPMRDFRRKVRVEQTDVFELPKAKYQLGTMFFVACSLTGDKAEFRDAVDRFVRSLTTDAPFAAAFMTGSTGYRVAKQWFPAVPVNREEVSRSFDDIAYDVKIHDIVSTLRPSVGMVLATGRASEI